MKKFLTILFTSVTFPSLIVAQILVDDKFSDGDRTNGSDAADVAWFYGTNTEPTVGVVDVGGDNRLRVTAAIGSSLNPLLTSTFSPASLSIGQTISFSFEFTSSFPAHASGIRFGIFNGGGTNFSADLIASPDTPPAFGSVFHNDVGFSVFAPHGQTGTIQLSHRAATSTANANLLAAALNSPIVGASTALASATNTTSVYSAGLTLTRTGSGYDYSVSYAGTFFSGSTALSPTATFDTIGILAINDHSVPTSQSLTIDNVLVSVSSIPEPSSFAIIAGFGAFATISFSRRRSLVR